MALVSSVVRGGLPKPSAAMVTVDEDVWIDGPNPGQRQRRYRRGDRITEAEAASLGLKKERAVQDKKAAAPTTKKRTTPTRAKQE